MGSDPILCGCGNSKVMQLNDKHCFTVWTLSPYCGKKSIVTATPCELPLFIYIKPIHCNDSVTVTPMWTNLNWGEKKGYHPFCPFVNHIVTNGTALKLYSGNNGHRLKTRRVNGPLWFLCVHFMFHVHVLGVQNQIVEFLNCNWIKCFHKIWNVGLFKSVWYRQLNIQYEGATS